jgi:ElaB/YqjD/DUF883 family membrane-anchored ribosome-binding protein
LWTGTQLRSTLALPGSPRRTAGVPDDARERLSRSREDVRVIVDATQNFSATQVRAVVTLADEFVSETWHRTWYRPPRT